MWMHDPAHCESKTFGHTISADHALVQSWLTVPDSTLEDAVITRDMLAQELDVFAEILDRLPN
jgi:hypothetical protein